MAQAIKDVMTPDPICVDPHDSAADAARRQTSALADISGAPANQ